MIASMASFAVADAFVKISTTTLSPAQVMFYLTAGGLILFWLLALVRRDKLLDARAFSPMLLFRYLAEVTGMIGMIIALATVPFFGWCNNTSLAIARSGRRCLVLERASGISTMDINYCWFHWCTTHRSTWRNRIQSFDTMGSTGPFCAFNKRFTNSVNTGQHAVVQFGNFYGGSCSALFYWMGSS